MKSLDDKRVLDFPEASSVQDQAAEWLAKLDADDLDPQTIAAFKGWLKKSPEHLQVFEKHQRLWSDMNVLTRMTPPLKAEAYGPKWTHSFTGWAQAAVVCVVLVAFALVQWSDSSKGIYHTAVGEQKTLWLADGTRVLLNTNTEVQVSYTDSKRAIYLNRGEAHFDVAHNPAVPFEVYAGKGRVRAVGTAFSVYLRSDDVEVVVTDGTVAILPKPVDIPEAAQTHPAAISTAASTQGAGSLSTGNIAVAGPRTVSAGSVAVYDRHTAEHVQLAALDKSEGRLSWHDGLLVFRAEPLVNVVAEVNRYTTLKIVIPSDALKAMKVGGFFKVDDIHSVFEALEKGFDIHAEYVDDDVVYLVYREQ